MSKDWAVRIFVVCGAVAVMWIFMWATIDGEAESVLFSMPRWALVVVGVVCLQAWPFAGSSRSNRMPLSPGRKESWGIRVRRAFVNR